MELRILQATFATDYMWLTSNPGRLSQFKADVAAAVASAVGIPGQFVSVVSVVSGSVVAFIAITLPSANYPGQLVGRI